METKEPTNGAEQETVSPQESATVNETGTLSEESTAIDADIVAKEATQEEVTPNVEAIAETETPIEVAMKTTENEVVEASENQTEETEPIETSEEELNPEKEDVKEVENTENTDAEADEEAESTEEDDSDEDENQEIDYSSLELEELVHHLVEAVKVDEITKVKTKVGNIKAQYIKKIKQIKQDHFDKFVAEGGLEEVYETIKFDFEDLYQGALSVYKDKRSQYLAGLEEMKEANLKEKEALLEALRNMINSDENLNKIYNEFRELQNRWREIGQIPQAQVNGLWENYHFLVEKFFEKVQINKELMFMGLNKNLEEKILICEKTEELLLEKSINKSFKLLQEFHEKWKAVGPVPQEKNDEIWERFKNATDKVNQRRHEYYENLNEEQKNNLVLKTALCEKAEEISDGKYENVKAWNKGTDAVNALFDEWKTLGPAPKKHNDSIWKRFKTAVNNFYTAKKEFLNQIKDEQMNNYHLKLDLIAQAEAVQDSQEWKQTTFEMVKMQKKWKEIGPVPKKYSEKIWKKFREACDHFFNAKEKFFNTIGEVESENQAKKLALIEVIATHEFGKDQADNLKVIKDFQRQWIDIGRVPFKEKAKLQSMYNKVIDKHLSKLNINAFEFENAGFKNKIEKVTDKREGERMVLKEINALRTRIDGLQKDVNLWDNNISFFATSKNADLLKADFEKKINAAKKEIDLLKAKIRQFDKMMRNIGKEQE